MKACFIVSVVFGHGLNSVCMEKMCVTTVFCPFPFPKLCDDVLLLPLIQLSEISSRHKSVFVIVYIGQQPQCSELEKTNRLESLNSLKLSESR